MTMKTLLIAVSALALTTPALAQMEPSPSTSQPTTPQLPGTAPVDQSAMGTTDTATTPAAPSDPKALIASEFPSYDKDANGALSKTEFAAWMGALKAKTGEPAMKPAEMTKWSDGAFATADKDKNTAVSLAELQNYLTAGA
jgi:Ca2+-binding EF-hand superfamily protein